MRVSVRTSLPLLKGYQQQTIEEGSVGDNLEGAMMLLPLRVNIG